MAEFALVDAAIWVAGVDFSGDSNKLTLSTKAEELDATTFGSSGYRSRVGGLRDVDLAVNGYWSSTVDVAGVPNLGTMDQVVTVSPDGAESSVAYMFRAGQFSYELGDQVGALLPYSVDLMGSNSVGLVRGRVIAAPGDITATGAAGTAQELGAVSSSQFVYCAFHVFSAGTTITAKVQSDADSTFATATDQATIGPITAAGGTWVTRVAGPITDTWWRVNVTAITGTFNVAASLAIQ